MVRCTIRTEHHVALASFRMEYRRLAEFRDAADSSHTCKQNQYVVRVDCIQRPKQCSVVAKVTPNCFNKYKLIMYNFLPMCTYNLVVVNNRCSFTVSFLEKFKISSSAAVM